MKTLYAPLAVLAVVFLMNSPTHAGVETPTTPAQRIAPVADVSHADNGVQLADEITRRIRRLGIHVIRFPNTRPTEMLGEMC